MLETFRNAWKIEDLRKRLLFTLLILVLFRLGCAIPVPYISAGALTSMFAGGTGDMLEYLNMMSGGALSECTLFALGVQAGAAASASVLRAHPARAGLGVVWLGCFRVRDCRRSLIRLISCGCWTATCG